MIRELAENANTYQPLREGQERVIDPQYVIWLGSGHHDPHWTVVQRVRLTDEDVEAALGKIREQLLARGRKTCTWEIADSATPPDLVERLLALGLVPDDDPVIIGMVLRSPPSVDASSAVIARRVETAEEAEIAARIAGTAFSAPAAAVEEIVLNARREFARADDDAAMYLGFVDGDPVASGTAVFLSDAALLFGGATLADARGRGAYRALVRARWDDAVARGTPALVTHAGAMSRPILERLGFEALSRTDILVDRFA